MTASLEYKFDLLGKQAYVWAENTYRTANTGPFSTHNPENTVVYDPDLVPDPPYNVISLRAAVQFDQWDVSLFIRNAANRQPQLSVQHTNPGDPRYRAVTLTPRTVGVTGTYRY